MITDLEFRWKLLRKDSAKGAQLQYRIQREHRISTEPAYSPDRGGAHHRELRWSEWKSIPSSAAASGNKESK